MKDNRPDYDKLIEQKQVQVLGLRDQIAQVERTLEQMRVNHSRAEGALEQLRELKRQQEAAGEVPAQNMAGQRPDEPDEPQGPVRER